MWTALSIIAFLAALITVILLLPVYIVIRNDEDNNLILRYKFLFKTFGENPNPNDPIVKMLKKSAGVDRFEKNELKKSVQSSGLLRTVAESYSVLGDLLKQIAALLRYCTATRFHIKILTTGEDAAQAAIHYGQYCAATYGLLNAVDSIIRIRKRNCKIDIGCEYAPKQDQFRYDVVIAIRFNHLLAAFWRVAYREAQRMSTQDQAQQK